MTLNTTTCKEHLDQWLEADMAVATGQSYQIGSRALTRADAKDITEKIKYWTARLAEAENAEARRGRNRVYQAVYRDL